MSDIEVTFEEKQISVEVPTQAIEVTIPWWITVVNQTIEWASYTHTQSVASATRTMTHNLGYNPNYIAVDSLWRQFCGIPSRPDTNTMVLTLSAATSGVAYLS